MEPDIKSLKGKVQSVTGLLSPSELGKTLVHEHLSMSFDVAYIKPNKSEELKSNQPFSLKNLGWIRYNPYSHQGNLQLNGRDCEESVLDELKDFRLNGGGTIVECTTHGISRKAQFLRDASLQTGVKIIAGTGYYVAASQHSKIHESSIEQLADVMRTEQLVGCLEAQDVRCGLIGEIGCSFPLHSFEKRVLEAAAQVQQELQCPVSIHPGRDPESPGQVLRCFLEAGGKADRVAVCHLDRTLLQYVDRLLEFASMGSYLEFDLFGNECSFYQLNHQYDMPSDAQRIDCLKNLIEEGFERKLIISHDIHTKHRLVEFGGHGYSHILENIVPRSLEKGLTKINMDTILISNPMDWLTYS